VLILRQLHSYGLAHIPFAVGVSAYYDREKLVKKKVPAQSLLGNTREQVAFFFCRHSALSGYQERLHVWENIYETQQKIGNVCLNKKILLTHIFEWC